MHKRTWTQLHVHASVYGRTYTYNIIHETCSSAQVPLHDQTQKSIHIGDIATSEDMELHERTCTHLQTTRNTCKCHHAKHMGTEAQTQTNTLARRQKRKQRGAHMSKQTNANCHRDTCTREDGSADLEPDPCTSYDPSASTWKRTCDGATLTTTNYVDTCASLSTQHKHIRSRIIMEAQTSPRHIKANKNRRKDVES